MLALIVHCLLCVGLGLSVGYINPFLLSVYHVGMISKDMTIRIRSVQLKLSLFDLSNVLLVVDGLELTLRKKGSKEAPSERVPVPTLDDLGQLDPDSPICIYSQHKKLRMFVKFYLFYFRFIGVKLFDIAIKTEDGFWNIHIDSFQTRIDMNSNKKDNVQVKARIVQANMNTLEALDSLAFEATGSLDTESGELGGLKLKMDTRAITLRVTSLIKRIQHSKLSEHLKSKSANEPDVDEADKLLTHIHQKMMFFCLWVRLIESCDISFQSLCIRDYPLASFGIVRCPEYKPMAAVHLNVKSIVFSMQRMFADSPGFGLTYNHGDKPYRIVVNLTGVSMQMEHIGATPPKEILSVPNIAITGSSNIAFRTLEATITGETSKGKAILSGHFSEPLLDMSTSEISLVVQSVLNFLTYMRHMFPDGHQKKPSRSSNEKSWLLCERVSSVWPTLKVKVGIENPIFMTKSAFEDDFLRILLLRSSLISLELATKRDFTGDRLRYIASSKLAVNDMKIAFRDTKLDLSESILNVGDINTTQLCEILPTTKLYSSFYTEDVNLDLSQILVLNGVNYIIGELDSMIVPQFRHFLRSAKLEREQFSDTSSDDSQDEEPKKTDSRRAIDIVHGMIPEWLKKVEHCCTDTNIIVGSRSVLLNKDLIKSIHPQAKNDLINDELRKVQFSVEKWSLTFDTSDDDLDEAASSTMVSLEDDDMGLLDTFSEDSGGSDKWKVNFCCSKTLGKIVSEKSSDKHELHNKVFLRVPDTAISFKPCPNGEDELYLSWKVSRIEAFYSVITHFIIISGFHLVRNTIFEFMHKNPIGGTWTDKSSKPKSSGIGKKILQQVQLSMDVGMIDLIVVMPDRMKMRLELTDFDVEGSIASPISVGASYTRLCTESPTSPGYWSRLITAVNGTTMVNLPTILAKGDGPWVETGNESCHIATPHQLIIYRIFDNISVMFKTLKQLHYSLKWNSDEIVINPSLMKPKKLPKINLRSNKLEFSMEDDPFESELNMIFQIGLLEQKMRLEKLHVFETRLKEALQTKVKPATPLSPTSKVSKKIGVEDAVHSIRSVPKKISQIVAGNTNSVSAFPVEDDNSFMSPQHWTPENTKQYLNKIYEGFSKSWITRVKAYRKKLEDNFTDNFHYIWGIIDSNSFPPGFNNRVLDFIKDPPLFSLILEGLDLDIGEPECGIQNLPDFLYDVGKGVPKDSKYSTLIPLHIDLKLDELKCHLRDYPLPFIYMPRLSAKQKSDSTAIRIHGDLVVGEFMIKSRDEVREVYVPLVPGCGEFDEDNCYSIEVPKTLTSIKFYTRLDWELHSEYATQVSWSSSYQPCIEQLILNLDNFTKPPIDLSEKVGFWDKIRANLHARVFFKFNESGRLDVVFKGSKNPYAIGGDSSGFLLGFKDDVSLTLNGNDDPTDFIYAKANQVWFCTPNHFAQPLKVWSRSTKNAVLLSDTSTNYQSSSFGYYLGVDGPPDTSQVNAMKDSYIEKHVIKLTGGVSFKLGFFFERKIHGSLERTSDFIPHFDVTLINPKYVKDRNNYDAYRGFRSQYIHMALSLISVESDAYNTIQLTPVTFEYFFKWWKMFSNTLPIRHGKLFGPEKQTKKFSRHLFTIKYQAIIEPLFVSHGYHNLEHKGQNHESDCVGIKGRASKFVLDLHQRKELTFEYNEKLGITKKAMKMKFNTGKVDLDQFDVRVMEALFEDVGCADADSTKKPRHIFSTFDGDETWFDLKDFDEIGEPTHTMMNTNVVISPIMYTPRFLYFKRNDYGDKYQIDSETGKLVVPFGNEKFHTCVIDSHPSSHTQDELFTIRIEELEAKFKDNNEKIEKLSLSVNANDQKILRNLKFDNEQLREGINFIKGLNHERAKGDGLLLPEDTTSEETFINCFIVHNMMLKWNDQNRDIMYRYMFISDMRDTISHFSQHKSLGHIDEAIETQRVANYEGQEARHSLSKVTTYASLMSSKQANEPDLSINTSRASEHMRHFKEDLRELLIDVPYKIHNNYLVKLISPQIQLQSQEDKDAVVLVVAPKIEMDGLAFDSNQDEDNNDEHIIEKRFGVSLTDASMFLFHEGEYMSTGKLFFNSSSYGSLTNWPPWLGVELCYDGSLINSHVLMEKTTVMIQFDKPTSFFIGPEEEDITRLSTNLSQVTLKCDSKQYNSLYSIIMNLLIYNDPKNLRIKQLESKMLLSLDFDDLATIKNRIVALQRYSVQLQEIIDNFSSKRSVLDDLDLNDLNLLKGSRFEILQELFLMMKVSAVGTRKSVDQATDFLEWNIKADDIKLHMLDENRRPFLDVLLSNSHFKRIESSDHSDRNSIIIDNLEVINLDKDSNLPVLFSSFDKDHGKAKKKKKRVVHEGDIDPLIVITWHMDYPVGGIRLMRKFDIAIKPVQLSIEEITGTRILHYVFPDQDIEEAERKSDDANSIKTGQSSVNTSPRKLAKPKPSQLSFHRNDSEIDSPRSSIANGRNGIDQLVTVTSTNESETDEEMDDMLERASKFLSFNSFRLRTAVLCVTFRGKGSKKLINVSNFVFTLPEVAFSNKTLTLLDLALYIKKMCVKALLSHTGSILGNKLTSHDSKQHVKNISPYASDRINSFRD